MGSVGLESKQNLESSCCTSSSTCRHQLPVRLIAIFLMQCQSCFLCFSHLNTRTHTRTVLDVHAHCGGTGTFRLGSHLQLPRYSATRETARVRAARRPRRPRRRARRRHAGRRRGVRVARIRRRTRTSPTARATRASASPRRPPRAARTPRTRTRTRVRVRHSSAFPIRRLLLDTYRFAK